MVLCDDSMIFDGAIGAGDHNQQLGMLQLAVGVVVHVFNYQGR